MDTNLLSIEEKVRSCLNELYTRDFFLFERNYGEGVGERCLTFRFGMYLQSKFEDYYVDVEYDNSMIYSLDENDGSVREKKEKKRKQMLDSNGFESSRIPDIIIHKRDLIPANDYLCFELKKWNRINRSYLKKDYEVLENLTCDYMYLFGFHIIFGKEKEKTKWTIFKHGEIIENDVLVFENSA
ncbi:hypothetical protein [Methanosarcina mazei]|uniref:hypothetical protein n=1 Tax=Methanosarcina mazei TaxID=2209 RepID=UPI000696D523|nr:hypothetical protein [Methanosarcina mazei]